MSEYDHNAKQWEDMQTGERSAWLAEHVMGIKDIEYPFVCDAPFQRMPNRSFDAVPLYMSTHELFDRVIAELIEKCLLREWAAQLLKIRSYGAAVDHDDEHVRIDMHTLGHFARWTVEDAGRAVWNMRERLVETDV